MPFGRCSHFLLSKTSLGRLFGWGNLQSLDEEAKQQDPKKEAPELLMDKS